MTEETPTTRRAYAIESRLSNGYVGTWQHLDNWQAVGTATILATGTICPDADDYCDPLQTIQLVAVETDEPEQPETIRKALAATNTQSGCSHDWDCCGCRSYWAHADHLTGNLYRVTINSSRNY